MDNPDMPNEESGFTIGRAAFTIGTATVTFSLTSDSELDAIDKMQIAETAIPRAMGLPVDKLLEKFWKLFDRGGIAGDLDIGSDNVRGPYYGRAQLLKALANIPYTVRVFTYNPTSDLNDISPWYIEMESHGQAKRKRRGKRKSRKTR